MPTQAAAPTKLPTLTDHAPFAPVAARMLELDLAEVTARHALRQLNEQHHARTRQRSPFAEGGGRFGGDESFDARHTQAEKKAAVAKAARDEYQPTYRKARSAAVAAVVPGVVQSAWRPALTAVAAALEAAAAELAKALAVKAELEAADLFHLPLVDALPAPGLLGDPADEWSPRGKVRAALHDLDPRPAAG